MDYRIAAYPISCRCLSSPAFRRVHGGLPLIETLTDAPRAAWKAAQQLPVASEPVLESGSQAAWFRRSTSLRFAEH